MLNIVRKIALRMQWMGMEGLGDQRIIVTKIEMSLFWSSHFLILKDAIYSGRTESLDGFIKSVHKNMLDISVFKEIMGQNILSTSRQNCDWLIKGLKFLHPFRVDWKPMYVIFKIIQHNWSHFWQIIIKHRFHDRFEVIVS